MCVVVEITVGERTISVDYCEVDYLSFSFVIGGNEGGGEVLEGGNLGFVSKSMYLI